MSNSQSAVEQYISEHVVKYLTAFDNTGLYCHSKKTKAILLAQQEKIRRKSRPLNIRQ